MSLFSPLGRYLAARATDAIHRRAAWYIVTTLKNAGVSAAVRVDAAGPGWPTDVRLSKENDGYRVSYPLDCPPGLMLSLARYAAVGVFWLANCPPSVREMTLNVSDGDNPSIARFAPSSRFPDQIAIPDPYFFENRGFRRERALATSAQDWSSRSDLVTWRGNLTGIGKLDFHRQAIANPLVFARLRLCLLTRGADGFDVRLSNIPKSFTAWTPVFQSQDLLGAAINEGTWTTYKYAIDIDGFSNTWSNFFIRMLFGCCIFKVGSQLGFRQWYYDRITPFEHYVPVEADMSDLLEKVDWARSHPAEARAIAENAQRFAIGLDFEAGKRDAVDIITANWDKSGP